MRGQWQSQTRRLNRHYQSVITKKGEIIPGFIDLNELTEIEEFDYIVNTATGVTSGSAMQIDSYDYFNERNSANTVISLETVGLEHEYQGIFGYSNEPAVGKMVNRIFDSYKTTFNPIGNEYHYTVKTFDGIVVGSTSPDTPYINVGQTVILPLYTKNDFPNYLNQPLVTIRLQRVVSNIYPPGSTLSTVFDIDDIIANGTFYSDWYKQIEYGDSYFINNTFYCYIEVNNNFGSYFSTKQDLINYMNQEFILFPIVQNNVSMAYHPSASLASCKYIIPKLGFKEVIRYV